MLGSLRRVHPGLHRSMAGWLTVVLISGMSSMPDVWAATLNVSPAGSDANNCVTLPCRSITKAMTVAGATDSISVAAGTYDTGDGETYPIELKTGVNVTGSSSDCSTGSHVIGDGTNTILKKTGGAYTATIGGFCFDAVASSNAFDFFVEAGTMNPTIQNNTIKGIATKTGIYIDDDSTAVGGFTGTIQNNTFNGWEEAIYVYQESGGADNYSPLVKNNTFTNNRYTFDDTFNTAAGGTNSPTLDGNTFLNSGTNDLYIYGYPGADFLHNLTITNNHFGTNAASSVTSPAGSSAIYVYGLYAYQRSANPNTTQTFTTDVENNVIRAGGVGVYADFLPEQAAANTPATYNFTIKNNTIHTTDEGIDFNVSMSNSSSAGLTKVNTTITGNHVTSDSSAAVESEESGLSDGPIQINSTISGNTIDHANDSGIYVSNESFSSAKSANVTSKIDGNVISNTGAGDTDPAIYLYLYDLYTNGSSAMSFEVNGNKIGPVDRGIRLFAEPAGDMNSLSILVQGNTVTNASDASGYGAYLDLSSFSSVGTAGNPPVVEFSDNVLTGGAGTGLEIYENTVKGSLTGASTHNPVLFGGFKNPLLAHCNTITNNAHDGVLLDSIDNNTSNYATPDFGGGENATGTPSEGNNVFRNNGDKTNPDTTYFDFNNQMNSDLGSIKAHNNYWGTTTPSVITGHINGAVDDGTPLSAAPGTSYTVNLSGPSSVNPGDTITYTAVLTGTSDCGQAAVVFSAGPPSGGGTIVVGSGTTTQGTILKPLLVSDNAVLVNVGFLDPANPVTITWQVTAPDNPANLVQDSSVQTGTGGTVSSTTSNNVDTAIGERQIVDTPVMGGTGSMLMLLGLMLAALLVIRRRGLMLAVALLLASGVVFGSTSQPHQRPPAQHVGTVTGYSAAGKMITLTMSDGTSVTLKQDHFRIVGPPVATARLSPGQKAPGPKGPSKLSPGSPIVARIKYRASGSLREVKVRVFASLPDAQAFAAKHPGKTGH